MNNHQHQQQDIHHIFVQNENDELDVNDDESNNSDIYSADISLQNYESNNSESGDFQSDSLPSSEDFQSDLEYFQSDLEQSLPSSDDLEQSEDVINDLDKSMDFGK